MKLRRPCYICVLLCVGPFVALLLLFTGPDMTKEYLLQRRIAELHERLRHAEMLNQERRRDILSLRQNFGVVLQASDLRRDAPPNATVHVGRGALWQKTQQLLASAQQGMDLQLPSLHHYLPHLLDSPDALQPALRLASGRSGVTVVLGIPTVKREVQSYLMSTLQNLIENMTPAEKADTVIVVFIAETDKEYVAKQATELETQFQDHIHSGLLEVISPPSGYYPDFTKLRQTLGDPMDRVRWRTKQNLDFAYLMMYSQAKGTFYVQLEDDILTKPGYITTMKNYAYKQISENKDWLILDFCQLGFIGKMFKCVDLSKLVAFFAMFHNDKPVDWLLDHLIQTKVCRFDKDLKECKKQKDAVWLHYRPSLFQHVGTHSSLRGKVQKLKDKQFGRLSLHYPHKNPAALVKSTIKCYKGHTLLRAYKGESFFWGLLPQRGDTISFQFTPPVHIERYFFRSGNAEHPDDKFFNTTVEVNPALPYQIPELVPYLSTDDGFLIVGDFKNQTGVAKGTIVPTVGPIKTMRLCIHVESDRWAILSEIYIKAVDPTNAIKR